MINSLHIDIEGGWGGSSASLCQLIRKLDREKISPVVVYRQEGPAREWYDELKIPAYHIPEIGSFVPRTTKAWKNLLASFPRLWNLDRAAARIAEIGHEHAAHVVHLNYEGLFLLASRLKRHLPVPFIGHSRALLPDDRWGRWLAQGLARNVEHMFFVSPQEEGRWQKLVPDSGPPGEVLWNISREPVPRLPFAAPPEAVYLGNLSPEKGTDRLIDIASELQQQNAPPLVISVFGEARQKAEYSSELAARIDREGLVSRIRLRGHTSRPAETLANAFALIRPSRDNDPWGRDVIEATSSGVPVLATGSFDGVIQPGVNGYLFPQFDAGDFAARLTDLLLNHTTWQRLSDAGFALGKSRFSGIEQSARFLDVATRLARDGDFPDW